MKIFENKDTSYEFDFCIINNSNRVIMFKFANSKRIKKDIKTIFNTNSELIITKRLEKYGLKLELVVQRPCYTLYNIVCINSWGGSREHNKQNKQKSMKIKFNLNDMKGSEEDA